MVNLFRKKREGYFYFRLFLLLSFFLQMIDRGEAHGLAHPQSPASLGLSWWRSVWDLDQSSPMSPNREIDYGSLANPISIRVDQALVESKIHGRPELKTILAQQIMAARELSVELRETIDLVITYLPGFQIRPLRGDQVISQSGGNEKMLAYFLPHRRELCINVENFNAKTPVMLAHEFIHALQVFSMQEFGSVAQSVDLPQAAATEAGLRDYSAAWRAADKRMEEMQRLLSRPDRELKTSEKRQLKLWREQAAILNNHSVMKSYDLSSSKARVISASTQSMMNFQKGQRINLDAQLPPGSLPEGDITVTKVTRVGDNFHIQYKFTDPLCVLLHSHHSQKAMIGENYPEHYHMVERPAYLRQYLPESVIKVFYKEVYQADRASRRQLQQKLKFAEPAYCHGDNIACYESLMQLHQKKLTGAVVTRETVGDFLMLIEYAIRSGNLHFAKQKMAEIDRALPSAGKIVNLTKARLKFALKEYKKAMQLFKQTYKDERLRKEMTNYDIFCYGVSAYESEQYASAKKFLTIAKDGLRYAEDFDGDPDLLASCEDFLEKTRRALRGSSSLPSIAVSCNIDLRNFKL